MRQIKPKKFHFFLILILISLISNRILAQLQTVYPNNASFNYGGVIPGVPNHLTPTMWNRVISWTTPDVSKTGLTNYGNFMSPEYNSTDGEPWLRCIDLPYYNGSPWVEGVYTTVTGLVPGRTYVAKFEQTIISAQIKMDGRWNVSLDAQTISGPWMTAPATPYSMKPWQNVALGPFVATSSTMVFKLEAEARNQAVWGTWDGCDLALDGVYLEGINNPPVANDDNLSVCSGIPNGTFVTTVVASDADGDVLTYSIVSGNTGGAFAINSSTGEITVANSAQVTANAPFNLVVQVADPYTGTDNANITISLGSNINFTSSSVDATCVAGGSITINVISGTPPYQYSIDGGSTFQASNTFNGLAIGSYNLMVKGGVGSCPTTGTENVGIVAPFTTTLTATMNSCTGSNTLNLTISGGIGPFSYTINGKIWDINNVVAGLNTAVIIDNGSGCSITREIYVNDVNPVVIDDITTTPVTCSANGSITVTASGGTPPFQYSNNGGVSWQGSNSFVALGPGNYDVVVRDFNNCTATQTVAINFIPPFTLDSIVTLDPTCGSSGAINIYMQPGGGAPIEYSIDGGVTFQSSGTFPGLSSGSYDLVVRDTNGCQLNQNRVLAPTPSFTLDGVVSNVTCAGLGTITINVSAPTATMEYSIDNGLTFQDTNFFTDLAAGVYDLMVRDHNSCFAVQSVNVINIPGFSVDSVNHGNETCLGLGFINMYTSGGTNPIRYSIDGGTTFFPSGLFPNLTAGIYDVVIEDANTCNHTETIVIDNILPVIDSIQTTDETCAVGGTLTVYASGGTNPLQYSIDGGSTFQPSNVFTGLTGGSYTVVVEDGNTCSANQNATVGNVPSFTLNSINTTDETCAVGGTITINVTGGTNPIQYSIDGGSTFQASNSFTGLAAGTYNVVIEDANTCSVNQNVIVGSVLAFTVDSVNTTDETCASTGSITIFVTGGAPPLQYSIDGGSTFQASNSFTGLTAATYNVVVEDFNTCSSNQNVVINNIPSFTLNSITTTDETCAGGGSITINVTGGTNPIQYSIDGGTTFQASNVFTGLTAATYSVVIEDANTCSASQNATVGNVPSFTLNSINTTDETCAVGGTITINVTGGTNPIQYSIDGGTTFQASNVFTGLSGGTYNVVIEDANTCSANQNAVVNTIGSFSLNSVNTTDVTCAALGTITISVTGGTPPFMYSVDGGANYQASNFFNGLNAGNYDVMVRDNNTCTRNQNAIINTIAPFTVNSVSTTDETCTVLGSLTINTSGGTPPIEFSIDGGSTYQSSGSFTGLSAGSYTVMIRDGNMCNVNQPVIVDEVLPPTLDSTVAVDDSCGACQGELRIYASGGTSPLTYSIDGGSTFQSSNEFISLCAASLNVEINDGNGCVLNANPQVLNLGTLADAAITAPSQICVTSAPIGLTAATSGGTWSGAGVDPSTGIFNPQIAGTGTHTIAYGISGACGDNDAVNITVVDTVNPNIHPVAPQCISGSPINLSADISGGVWSGDGIIDPVYGVFDPGTAGWGTKKVYYSVAGVCIDTDSLNISISDTITPLLDPVAVQCNENDPLQLKASIPGGTWSGTGITNPSKGTFDPALANVGSNVITYFINVGACSSSPTLNIDVEDSKNATIAPAGPFCTTESPSVLTAVDPGGTWYGAGINSVTGSFNPSAAGAGTHQIVYTIAGICGDSDTITVSVKQQPDVTISAVPVLCVDGDSIQLMAATEGGTWGGNGVSSSGIFTPVVAGNFIITYSISGFCGNSDQITITVEENPIIELSSNINNTCSGTEVTLSYISSTPLNNCLWDFGDGTTNTICGNVTHSYNEVGCYDISVRGDSPIGCRAKKEITDLVCIHPNPIAAFSSSEKTVKTTFPKIDFYNESKNAVSYVWNFSGIGSSTEENPSYKFPDVQGAYSVCLEARSEYGCIDTVCHDVYVEDDILINVPNAFTPNGDGVNDEFAVVLRGFGEKPKFLLQIWNRWGELVYESMDAYQKWNGIVDKHDPTTNTFVWKIYAIDNKGNDHDLIGHVVVLR